MASYDTNFGAKRARETRKRLGLDPDEPLDCVLRVVEQRAGIPVVAADMGDGLAGAYWHKGEHQLIHVNATQAIVRRRFTLAHELGHACCGHSGSVDAVATVFGSPADHLERQANAFAAEFLVPRTGLEQVLTAEPSLDQLVVLAAAYGVSAQAALYRCVTCGLVGDARRTTLEADIEQGRHLERYQALAPPVPDDGIAALGEDDLPYVSPAIRHSALGAEIRRVRG